MKARKNWQAIAGCTNEQLRHNLIASSGDIAEGLAKGFPEFFLTNDEEHPRVEREEFIHLAAEMERRDDIQQACKDAGLPYMTLSFAGNCGPRTTDGLPYKKGGDFWRSTMETGEEVSHEGAVWVLVKNLFARGNIYIESRHSLVFVPADAFAPAS